MKYEIFRCEYMSTSYEDNNFSIRFYRPKEEIKDPAGNILTVISAKGFNLPKDGNVCTLKGEWIKCQNNYYLNVEDECKTDSVSERDEKIIEKSDSDTVNILNLQRFLKKYLSNEKKIDEVYQELGKNAESLIKDNPYCIANISNIGFFTADKIAVDLNFMKDNSFRIQAAILQVLKESEQGGKLFISETSGNTFTTLEDLALKSYELLGLNYFTEKEKNSFYKEFVKHIKKMSSGQEIAVDEVIIHKNTRKAIGLSKTVRMENDIAQSMAILALSNPELVIKSEELLKRKENQLNIILNSEQEHAINKVFSNMITIITGGPGTGKTTIVKMIIEIYQSMSNSDILLAAPTGKAARVLTDKTGMHAQTLHSALMLGVENNEEIVQNLHKFDLIIVDEFSMVDTTLAYHFFRAVKAGTRIVILGDNNQLPSVGPGAILRELIKSEVIETIELKKIYRQDYGSSIACNAQKIKRRNFNIEFEDDFSFIEASDSEEIVEILETQYKIAVDKFGADEVSVLTPYRQYTPTGVNQLNPILRNLVNKNGESEKCIKINDNTFYLHDKVMYTENIVKLNVANGDIGYIVDIGKTNRDCYVQVDFGNERLVLLDKEHAKKLTLAYSFTVHKSQGSEYKCVIFVSDKTHKNMLKNNLIYTGITRAKEQVIIIGSKEDFIKGISTLENERNSLLSTRIKSYF